MADETLSVRKGTMGSTELRFHEMALQRWFYSTFFVAAGYPIPVVFGTPMDAFGNFNRLWKKDKSPFAYLFALKDTQGRPLYEPTPSNLRYPLISVLYKSSRLRVDQSYGLHQYRHMNWPTVADNVQRCDLGNVSVSQRPMGWDFRFQVDHYCMRPDTQAFFTHAIYRAFAVGGGTPQTWVPVYFPVLGWQKIRLFLDGDVENSTKDEPEDQKHVEFRTTFNLVMEGYSIDQDIEIVPALWTLVLRGGQESASPGELDFAFNEQQSVDLRLGDNNPDVSTRANIPSDTQCQIELAQTGTYPPADITLSGTDQPGVYLNFGFTSTNPASSYFMGGIPRSQGFGIASVGSL
jgi:hypothetical protein